jgi:hypothetical protein
VAIEDGWPNVIHVCKEDGNNMRLDKDKKRDLKEKKTRLPSGRKCSFWW